MSDHCTDINLAKVMLPSFTNFLLPSFERLNHPKLLNPSEWEDVNMYMRYKPVRHFYIFVYRHVQKICTLLVASGVQIFVFNL